MLSRDRPNGTLVNLVARRRILRERDEEWTCTPRLHRERLAKTGLREDRNTEAVESLCCSRPFRTADRTNERTVGHSLAMRKQDLGTAPLDVRLVSVRRRKLRKFGIRPGPRAPHE
jgi:hypothetical protein